MKIKFLLIASLCGAVFFSSCKKSVPSTNVTLATVTDSISYSFGASATQNIDMWLMQNGILKDTMEVVMEYAAKISEADDAAKATLEKERNTKITSINKANKAALELLAAGIAEGFTSSDEDKAYYMGVGIGQNLTQNLPQLEAHFLADSGDKVNKQAVLAAVTSSILKGSKAMPNAEMYIQQKDQEIRGKQEAKQMEAAVANKASGEKFLEDNKSKEGVITLPSGVQYKILESGKAGGKKASKTGEVMCDYKGYLIDGTVFDSSYDRGQQAKIAVNSVIPAWQEILPMMPEGSKWEIYVPSEMGYGDRAAGQHIQPNSTLCFEIEVHEVLN